MRLRWFFVALLTYCTIAVSLTGPALVGLGSITPEGFLDKDFLYKLPTEAALRPFGDPTAIALELGRDRAVASGLKQGRIDTWNPWSAAGAPLWAEQGGPFFPTKLIYYLYPHQVTLFTSLAARLVVAALGMFFLARALGLSPFIALFTGALFEYSGICTAVLTFATFSAMYMLPWGVLGAHKLVTERGAGAVATTGLALGITFLGGNPSFALIVYLAFGAWILGECLHRQPPLNDLVRLAGLTIAAGSLASLVAAVGLLPFIELLWHGHSYKNTAAADVVYLERLGWTRDVFAIAMFYPSLISAARDTVDSYFWPWAAGASIGLVALLLAIAGAQKLRAHWGLALMAILGIGLTLAPPGLQWLHQLPGVRIILNWYCYPLLIVPLCLAAGLGLQVLAAAPRKHLLLVPFGVGLLAIIFLGVVLLGVVRLGGPEALQSIKNELWTIFGLELRINPLRVDMGYLSNWQTFVSPVAAIAAVIAYALMCRTNLARAVIIVAILALIEAAAVRIPTVIFERSVVLRSEPSEARTRLQTLLSGGYWRYVGVPPLDVGMPNTALLFDLRDFRSLASLTIRRITKFMELAGTEAEDPWQRPEWQYPVSTKIPMLSVAAVKYVIYTNAYRSRAKIPSGLKEQETVGEVVFFENPFALPRFRIVHDIIPVEGEQQAFEALQRLLDDSSSSDASEWTRRSVIEGIGRDEAVQARAGPDPSQKLESVRLLAEPDPQTIVLEASLDTPGFVIVDDTFYPGWTATVDDLPTVIHPANLLFRAVAVPAGRHTIVMKYESSWLRIGAVLTLIGLLLAAVLLVRERSINRRPRYEQSAQKSLQ